MVYCDNGHPTNFKNYDPYGNGVTCNGCNGQVAIEYGFNNCEVCQQDFC